MDEATKRQIEDKVIEECSELIKAVVKARRFGYCNFHPTKAPYERNFVSIMHEIVDVCDAMKGILTVVEEESKCVSTSTQAN